MLARLDAEMHLYKKPSKQIKQQVGDGQVIMALSGGVDSTVAATIIAKAIGDRLHGIFVDNGVLRKNEFEQVLATYKQIGLNVKGVDRKNFFTMPLKVKPIRKKNEKQLVNYLSMFFRKKRCN